MTLNVACMKKQAREDVVWGGKSYFTRDLGLNRVRSLGLAYRREYVHWSRVKLSECGASLSKNLRVCIDFLQQDTATFPHVKVNSV